MRKLRCLLMSFLALIGVGLLAQTMEVTGKITGPTGAWGAFTITHNTDPKSHSSATVTGMPVTATAFTISATASATCHFTLTEFQECVTQC